MTPPVVIVGVDGLPPRFLQQLIDEGRTPNIAQLAGRGTLGVLRSTPNYQSASAWTSFATGVNPGKHGVFHFTNPVRGSYRFAQIDSRARHAPTIWRMLSDAGARVAALNVPVSYPVEPLDGVMVAGWLCPSPSAEGFTHPPELAARLGDYPIHPDVRRHARVGAYDVVAETARGGISAKLDTACAVFQRERPDVLCAVVTETDSVQHWCWHLLDPDHPQHDAPLADRWREDLLSVYASLDEALGRLLSVVGKDANVLIVSDHGQAPNSGGQVLLRPWLVHRGYLVPRSRTAGDRAADALVRSGFEAVRRHASNRLKTWLRAHFPAVQGRAQVGVRGISPDWGRTRAWTEGGHIFVNTRGTWPEGCVDALKERGRLISEIRDGLLELRDADTGEQAIASVTIGEDEFAGPASDLMPALLVHWRNDLPITRLVDSDGAIIERTDAPELPFGAHHPDGTLLTCGPSFRRTDRAYAHSIYDVAPTLLHLLRLPVPAYFDGRVMTDLMMTSAAKDVRGTAGNVPTGDVHARRSPVDDDEIVTERLRSLGYVE